jgi:hypothetical protein
MSAANPKGSRRQFPRKNRATSAGTVRVKTEDGRTTTLDFVAGQQRTGQFLRVLDTGTTVGSDSAGEGIEGAL